MNITSEKTRWGKPSSRYLVVLIHVANALAILFEGYSQGVIAGVNVAPDYVNRMDLSATRNGIGSRQTKLGGIVCSHRQMVDTRSRITLDRSLYTTLGAMFAALAAGWLADTWGRIRALQIGCVWCVLGCALQASAQNDDWQLCARVITGFGVAHMNVVAPTWSSEVSEAEHRGKLFGLIFLANYVGITIAYWIGFGLRFVDNGNSSIRWRLPFAINAIPPILLFLLLFVLPESPRFLIRHDRLSEAKDVLARVRGVDPNRNDSTAAAEFNEIVASVRSATHAGVNNSYWAMMTGYKSGKLHLGRRVQLALWLQILMQIGTGIAATTIYSPTLFAQAGWDDTKAEWLAALNATVGIVGTTIVALTRDRMGTRRILFVGAIGQSVCMFLSGGMARLTANHPSSASQYGAASVSFIFLFTLIFSSTWLTIPFHYPAEIFPTEVRAKGNAFGVIGWAIGFGAGTLFNPPMFEEIASSGFYLYGAFNLVLIPIIWAFYPETSRRSLESIDLLFMTDSPFAWKMEESLKVLSEQQQPVEVHEDKLYKMDSNG